MTVDGLVTDTPLAPTLLTGLRPEAELLLALARRDLTEEQRDGVRRFLAARSDELDWGYFVTQCCRHLVLPLVGRNLARLRLDRSEEGGALMPFRWLYTEAYQSNRRRNLALGDEFGGLLRRLTEAGLPYAVRRGPVLDEWVYGDPGLVRLFDLEVLMRRGDLPRFEAVAAALGYRQGRQSGEGAEIVPFDRRTQLYWRLHLTNTMLPFAKVGNRDDVETFLVTGGFSVFQPKSGVRVDGAEEMLARAVPTVLYGESTFMLDRTDQVVDAAVQLHAEATLLYHIESGKDLAVRRHLDLVELLRRHPVDRRELADRVADYGCAESVYYGLYFARQVYPDAIPEALLSDFRPNDVSYLDEYGGFDGVPRRWSEDFPTRLFGRRDAPGRTGSGVPGVRPIL